ncbi:MAG: hypothetical protein BGO80_07810 [Devosia sp. 63-57]|nr:MAG: hypothetical protein ABS74_07240 [Pelagibacterium sp. SCN 63-126]OJX45680.1 MAG: hypothetical protein BGO80_07810 [Devosia sp. 63-57]
MHAERWVGGDGASSPSLPQDGTSGAAAHWHCEHQLERPMQTYDPKKDATDVRQASPRKMNLRVLVTSMVAIVVLFAIIFIVYSTMQPQPA